MSDMAIFLDQRDATGETMNGAGILDIGILLDMNPAKISSQGSKRPDIYACFNHHISNQHSLRMYISARTDHRNHTINGITRHYFIPLNMQVWLSWFLLALNHQNVYKIVDVPVASILPKSGRFPYRIHHLPQPRSGKDYC